MRTQNRIALLLTAAAALAAIVFTADPDSMGYNSTDCHDSMGYNCANTASMGYNGVQPDSMGYN